MELDDSDSDDDGEPSVDLSEGEDPRTIAERINGGGGGANSQGQTAGRQNGGSGQRSNQGEGPWVLRSGASSGGGGTREDQASSSQSRYRIPKTAAGGGSRSTWQLMLNVWPLEDRPEVSFNPNPDGIIATNMCEREGIERKSRNAYNFFQNGNCY